MGAAAASQVQLNWRPGTQQTGYLIIRWDAIANQFAFLPRFDQLLGAAAINYLDPGPLPSTTYCYVALILGGSPATLSDVRGISDLLCIYPGTGSGPNPAGAFNVRLNEGSQAELHWTPATNQTAYELVAIRFDGSPVRTIPFGPNTTTFSEGTGQQTACYQLRTFEGGQNTGATDRICAAPGASSFSAGQPPLALPDALDRLRNPLSRG